MTFSNNSNNQYTSGSSNQREKQNTNKPEIKFDKKSIIIWGKVWEMLNEYDIKKININNGFVKTIKVIYTQDLLRICVDYGDGNIMENDFLDGGSSSPKAFANFLLKPINDGGLGLTLEELETAIKNTIESRKNK